MKTIVLNRNFLSIMIMNDESDIELGENYVRVDDHYTYNIFKNDIILYEDIDDCPDDWSSRKYFFNGVNWEINPDHVELDEKLPNS